MRSCEPRVLLLHGIGSQTDTNVPAPCVRSVPREKRLEEKSSDDSTNCTIIRELRAYTPVTIHFYEDEVRLPELSLPTRWRWPRVLVLWDAGSKQQAASSSIPIRYRSFAHTCMPIDDIPSAARPCID